MIRSRPFAGLIACALLWTFSLGGCLSTDLTGLPVPTSAQAEIVVYPAREIVTLETDPTTAEAVAVSGDRILAVGRLADIESAFPGRDLRIDRRFEDAVIVPGLINQHEHAWLAAIAMIVHILSIEDWVFSDQTMERATDAADYRRRLEALVREHAENPDNANRVFYTWGYHQLFHGPLSRDDLDAISRTVPIVVLQRSMHEVLFNSPALARFGIDEAFLETMPESAREQSELGRGHFWEQGSVAVAPRFFADLLTPARYVPALERARDYWHAAGSTLVAEPGGMVSPGLMALQNQVLGQAATPFRMHYIADGRSMMRGRPAEAVMAATDALAESAKGMTRFLPKQVKLFADGAMFSQLMQMSEGYLDGHDGEWLMDKDAFDSAFRLYWDAGFQIHVHQNGDAGLERVLDVLEENMQRNPRSDHRTVIVHFGFSRADQIPRIKRLGALVSANPFYTVVLADRYSEVGIGPRRAQEMVRLGDAVRAGISVSLHADMPMAPGKPLLLMSSAVNRRTVAGNVAGPHQRLTAEQALRAVTIDAAYSLRLEDEVGSIRAGKRANLTILRRNPLRVATEDIAGIAVLGTLHEGRWIPVQSTSRTRLSR